MRLPVRRARRACAPADRRLAWDQRMQRCLCRTVAAVRLRLSVEWQSPVKKTAQRSISLPRLERMNRRLGCKCPCIGDLRMTGVPVEIVG